MSCTVPSILRCVSLERTIPDDPYSDHQVAEFWGRRGISFKHGKVGRGDGGIKLLYLLQVEEISGVKGSAGFRPASGSDATAP